MVERLAALAEAARRDLGDDATGMPERERAAGSGGEAAPVDRIRFDGVGSGDADATR